MSLLKFDRTFLLKSSIIAKRQTNFQTGDVYLDATFDPTLNPSPSFM